MARTFEQYFRTFDSSYSSEFSLGMFVCALHISILLRLYQVRQRALPVCHFQVMPQISRDFSLGFDWPISEYPLFCFYALIVSSVWLETLSCWFKGLQGTLSCIGTWCPLKSNLYLMRHGNVTRFTGNKTVQGHIWFFHCWHAFLGSVQKKQNKIWLQLTGSMQHICS